MRNMVDVKNMVNAGSASAWVSMLLSQALVLPKESLMVLLLRPLTGWQKFGRDLGIVKSKLMHYLNVRNVANVGPGPRWPGGGSVIAVSGSHLPEAYPSCSIQTAHACRC